MKARRLARVPFLLCVALALSAGIAAANPIVVTFDNLSGDNLPVPEGYGGINWLNGWKHYGFSQEPYTARSPRQRVYATRGSAGPASLFERAFEFTEPNQLFAGAWFAGNPRLPGRTASAFVQLNLYDNGVLVHTSGMLTPSSSPAFLSAGYAGRIDRVGVLSNNAGYWVMDDVTYGTTIAPIPEPASLFLLGSGLFGFTIRRLRAADGRVVSR